MKCNPEEEHIDITNKFAALNNLEDMEHDSQSDNEQHKDKDHLFFSKSDGKTNI